MKAKDAHSLDKDYAMELVDSMPRSTDSERYVGGLALEKGVIDVSLELCRGWSGRASRRVHEGKA